jgi:hypothetical protein
MRCRVQSTASMQVATAACHMQPLLPATPLPRSGTASHTRLAQSAHVNTITQWLTCKLRGYGGSRKNMPHHSRQFLCIGVVPLLCSLPHDDVAW